MAKDFDRIHKSVRWPYTYDNTDLLIALSSNWLGHHPFTVKITGSSPVGVTDSLIGIEICGGVKWIGTPEIGKIKNTGYEAMAIP